MSPFCQPAGSVPVLAAFGSVPVWSFTSFIKLSFTDRHWSEGQLALTLFCIGVVVSRFLLGNRIDRSTGPSLLIGVIVLEIMGLLVFFAGSNPWFAAIGAFAAGFGYSMTYPVLALVAVKHAAPFKNVGSAIAAFELGWDIALMIATPICGILAQFLGTSSVFLFAAVAAFGAILIGILAQQQSIGLPHRK